MAASGGPAVLFGRVDADDVPATVEFWEYFDDTICKIKLAVFEATLTLTGALLE